MPDHTKALAIFDFDDTLFNGQSHSYFFSFLESQFGLVKMLQTKVRKRFEGSSKYDDRLHKEYLLKPFSGLPARNIDLVAEKFYQKVVIPRIRPNVASLVKQKKSEGFQLVLASGGFRQYLRYFAHDFKFDSLVCSDLEFNDGQFTGKILGDECLGEAKARMLQSTFPSDTNWKESYFYSDHSSDLPTLNLVGYPVVVASKDANLHWVPPHFEVYHA